MKIGLVCPYNMYKGGGVQECVKALQAELIRRGHQVRIITPLPREADAKEEDGYVFIGGAADIKSPFHTTAQVSVSVNNEAVDEMIAREKFDVLHFHEPWVPIVSRQILARSQCGNVATFHAKLPETVMSKTIERVVTPYTKSIMKYLDALTAVSDAAATYVQTLTEDPITIIPNGIDLGQYKWRQDWAVPPNDGHIVFIGRLERRKGVKYLLKAFALFSQTHPHARLTIAGDGPDRAKLEALAKSLHLKHVEFLGYVDEDAKQRLLHDADLLCSPALFGESFGIVLLEAMAVGIPIVAGNNPGYTGVMRDRGILSLVNPKDAPQFARRLDLMLYDTEVRKLWREWAAEYVQQFAYPRVVDRYEALYRQVCE